MNKSSIITTTCTLIVPALLCVAVMSDAARAADTPCLGLAKERKGYGIALIPLNKSSVNKFTGHTAGE